jgi:hypothetical protein
MIDVISSASPISIESYKCIHFAGRGQSSAWENILPLRMKKSEGCPARICHSNEALPDNFPASAHLEAG